MGLTLVDAPAVLPVSAAEVKSQSRVDIDDDDTLIARVIAAAVAHLDGADGWLQRVLITQTWDLSLPGFPSGGDRAIRIPLPPLQQVVSISYIDADGGSQTLATGIYTVVGTGQSQPARVVEAYNQSWPDTRAVPEAVTVRFKAGYGDAATDVPEDIRHAILMTAAHWYEHRESVSDRQMQEVPHTATDLLRQRRVWDFG